MNTSATGGYIVPYASAPSQEAEDDAFLDFMHDVIQGITGLDATLIRPMWQPEPPTMPPRSASWVGFRLANRVPDQTGYEAHYGVGDGRTALIRYEDADLMLAFYGSMAETNAIAFREGLLIGQNREVLTAAGIGVKSFAGPQQAPVLFKEQWLYRSDLTVTLRRQIRHVYPILNIIQGVGVVETDTPPQTTPFSAGA